MTIDYKLGYSLDGVFAEIRTILLNKTILYSIEKHKEDTRPVQFFTATTGMKDWIGNVCEMQERNNDVFCVVEGIYQGSKRKVKNIKLRVEDAKVGERVMVTEHINVSGGFDMLATKKRLLDLSKPDLNFINIGWSDDKECRYLRIDPYTGETKQCVGEAVG